MLNLSNLVHCRLQDYKKAINFFSKHNPTLSYYRTTEKWKRWCQIIIRMIYQTLSACIVVTWLCYENIQWIYISVIHYYNYTNFFFIMDWDVLMYWPNSQIPEWICSISHITPFRTKICKFLFWTEHCGIWNRYILIFFSCFYWAYVCTDCHNTCAQRTLYCGSLEYDTRPIHNELITLLIQNKVKWWARVWIYFLRFSLSIWSGPVCRVCWRTGLYLIP